MNDKLQEQESPHTKIRMEVELRKMMVGSRDWDLKKEAAEEGLKKHKQLVNLMRQLKLALQFMEETIGKGKLYNNIKHNKHNDKD